MKIFATTMPALRSLLILTALLVATAQLTAQDFDHTQPPALGPPPDMQPPMVQRLILKNGLPVLLVEKHSVPLVQINLQIKAGSVYDPDGFSGLARMTADMLDEGAGGRDALELADAIDYLGANLSTRAGRHSTVIALNTPLAQLDAALPLLADVALKPAFAADDLERKRKERLTTLIQQRDTPRTVAILELDQVLYGPQHPYGRPTGGDAQGLQTMRVRDLKKFYRTWYRPNNATLIVVGDITAAEIIPKLENLFGKWRKRRIRPATWQEAAQVSGRTIYLVDKPGAAQSEIRIGRIGVPRSTGDYYTLEVLNTILGGAFTSRLNQNLREEHGYSYGARSSFSMGPQAGPFVASAAVQTEVTDKALSEFMNELRGILELVPDDELEKSKNYVALTFPAAFQTVSRIAGQLQELALNGLPTDTFNRYSSGIYGVTAEAVAQAAAKYIDPENLAIVVVGDRSKVEAGIMALGLGKLVSLSIEDVMGPPPAVAD